MFNPNDYGLEAEDLPTWMRPRYRGIDWTMVLTLILCLVVSWPILNAPVYSIPRSIQAETQLHRIVEMASMMESGQVYPRWAANFNYGYGSPIFNHLAPWPYYLGGAYLVLTRDAPPIALKAVLLLGIICLGLTTTAFARRRWGDTAGIIATSLILFSPSFASVTHLYTDSGVVWASVYLMGGLWSIERLTDYGRGRDIALLAVMTAGLSLSHATLMPILLALLAGWAVLRRSQYWGQVISGLLLGIGIASIFLIPALLEADAVQWEALPVYPMAINLTTLFASPPKLDLALFNPTPALHLGIAQGLLALTGAVWLIWQRQKADGYFLVWGLGFIVALLIADGWGYQDYFEALRPTDLMLPLTICAALVASQVVTLIETRLNNWRRRWIALGIVTFILTFSAANTMFVPSYLAIPRSDTTTQHLNNELRGYMLGSLHDGQLLPRGVETLPDVSHSVVGNLEQIDKIDRLSLPRNTRVTILEHAPTNDTFIIENRSTAHQITILTFNYPGWHATRNREPLDLQTLAPNGFIGLVIEPEINDIRLNFGNTPTRRVAEALSGISLLLLVVLVAWREQRATPIPPSTMTPLAYKRLRERTQLNVLITLVLLVTYAVIQLRPSLVTYRTPETAIPSDAIPYERIIEGGLDFLGFNLSQTSVGAGDIVYLNTYWTNSVPNLPNYQLELSILHNGQVIERQTYRHLANWPSREWPLDGYVMSTYRLAMPSTTGEYSIVLKVGTCDRLDLRPCDPLEPRDIYDLSGSPTKEIVLPQTIRVE